MSENLQITDRLTTQEISAFNTAGVFPPYAQELDQLPPRLLRQLAGFQSDMSLEEQGNYIRGDFEDPFVGELPIIPYES